MLRELPLCWFIGRLNCVSGYGEAARHQMLALADHGLCIHGWHGNTHIPVKDQTTPFFQEVQCHLSAPDPTGAQPSWAIVHMTPDNAEPYRGFLPAKQVLSMVWETSHIPAYWIPIINTYTQVWVPTEWNREVLVRSGVTVPVYVVTFAFDPRHFPAKDELPVPPWVEPNRTTLASVFAWDARKNPEGLIRAYLHAFDGGDAVQLVIKSYAGETAAGAIQERVSRVVREVAHPHPAPVVVVNDDLTRDEMLSLIAHADIYVCASRGEGWGLPVTEAAMYDVPSIVPANSALDEQGLGYKVDCVPEPVWGMNNVNYTRPQVWETPRIIGMANAMRRLVDSPSERASNASIAKGVLDRQFNTSTAAKQAKKAVAALFSG